MMKKLLLIILALSLSIGQGAAQTTPRKERIAKINEQMKSFVTVEANGDHIIKRNPNSDWSKAAETPEVPGAFIEIFLHIDSDMEFDKLEQKIIKAKGKADTPLASVIIAAAQNFAKENKLSFSKIKFSNADTRSKIDRGIPLFASFKGSQFYKTIEARNERRGQASDMKMWYKTAARESPRNIPVTKLRKFALIAGYNEDSTEFLVYIDGMKCWVLELEMKVLLDELYQIRP